MKLYVRAPFSEKCLNELGGMFDEVVYEPWTTTGERYYEDEMLEHLIQQQPDALITELDRVTEKVLRGYDHLQFIGDCRGEPANIQMDACTAAGIPILCTPGRNTQAVAEMVVGLILAFYRRLIPAIQWTKGGEWVAGTTPYYLWMGNELQGKKVGFVGFGRISHAVAKILEGFDCDVSFYDPFLSGDQGRYHKRTLEEIFAESDIVSLHLPVMDSTRGMITEPLLRSMRKDALFVNAARSALVDYGALRRVLEEEKIRGAILDVLNTEPPTPEDLSIAKCPNVLLTPHICGATYEVTDHQSDILTNSIRKWLKEEDLEKIVYNRDVLKR
ncbi:NAD(P)-dependent oxidoreductase [Oscillibacter sp.]|uniref:2-hydroxyacid dehydrogenase n=1 Tax=Oscillibacter sp. TaxID=1945593 RepID=UPI003399DE03